MVYLVVSTYQILKVSFFSLHKPFLHRVGADFGYGKASGHRKSASSVDRGSKVGNAEVSTNDASNADSGGLSSDLQDFVGVSVSSQQIWGITGVFGACRISDLFPDPDVKESDLRALDPSYEGGKSLPTMERSGLMKPLPMPGVSVTGSEHGSPVPVKGGNCGPFGVDNGEAQVGWKGRSADGPHGSDDSPTTTFCRRSARKDDDDMVKEMVSAGLPVKDAGTEGSGIVWKSCSDDAKIASVDLDVSVSIVVEVTGSDIA